MGRDSGAGHWRGGGPSEFRVSVVRQLGGSGHGPELFAQMGLSTVRGYLLDTDEQRESGALEDTGAESGFPANEGALLDGN